MSSQGLLDLGPMLKRSVTFSYRSAYSQHCTHAYQYQPNVSGVQGYVVPSEPLSKNSQSNYYYGSKQGNFNPSKHFHIPILDLSGCWTSFDLCRKSFHIPQQSYGRVGGNCISLIVANPDYGDSLLLSDPADWKLSVRTNNSLDILANMHVA